MTSQWNAHIFRKNDIRGIYKQDFDLGFVRELAKGFVAYYQQEIGDFSTSPVVAVGYDARLSSPEIASCLSKALISAGGRPLMLGLVPSPVCFFASCFFKEVDGSIVVTASHNPPAFNGFKLMLKGTSINDHKLKKLEDLMQSGRLGTGLQSAKGGGAISFPCEGLGTGTQPKNVGGAISPLRGVGGANSLPRGGYVEFMRGRFLHLCVKKPKRAVLDVVIDCGNGASGPIAKEVFRALGGLPVRVHWLFDRPDGRFPNHHPDPSIEKNLRDLQQTLQVKRASFGVALDGDGDRLVVVDHKGYVLQGDDLMSIFIADIMGKQAPLPKGAEVKPTKTLKALVVDVKCADWFFDFLNTLPVRVKVGASGHSLIRQKTIEGGAIFGGELSGHFFFQDDNFFPIDDGVYALLRLIEICFKKGITCLNDLRFKTSTFNTPEIRFPAPDRGLAQSKLDRLKSFYIKDSLAKVLLVDGVRVSYPGRAWGLARFSNTQNEWTLRFGGLDKLECDKIQKQFYALLNLST